MPKKLLNGSDVIAVFQQVHSNLQPYSSHTNNLQQI